MTNETTTTTSTLPDEFYLAWIERLEEEEFVMAQLGL